MEVSAELTDLKTIAAWRDLHRLEMGCQIVHDSIHDRLGWTDEYTVSVDGKGVGYGSVAVGGPWKGISTVYQFYVAPDYRLLVLDLFRAFLDVSGAVAVVVQSNDSLATTMLHTFAQAVTIEAILFHDKACTTHLPVGAVFREPVDGELPDIPRSQLKWHGVVALAGTVVARGGILFHYNRPFGDIYMDVDEPFRRRGLGSFLVQELKRVCYEGGHVPAARCGAENIASRRTLERAGFVPCGHILKGSLQTRSAP